MFSLRECIDIFRKTRSVLVRIICLIFYYGFARWLPASNHKAGRWARRFRSCVAPHIFRKCGTNVNIEQGAFFGSGRGISIGNNSSIGVDAKILGPIVIGDNVMMGPDVVVLTTQHNFSRVDIPMIEQGMSEQMPVTIGSDVWIGTRVIVQPGVVIGSGSVIASGCVVTRDIPAWAVVAGVPGRVLKYRS